MPQSSYSLKLFSSLNSMVFPLPGSKLKFLMLSKKHLFSLLCLTLLLQEERGLQAEAGMEHDERDEQVNKHSGATKLFVFGDSYADTGNTRKGVSTSVGWKEPYGMTYPGKPAGRASDGRVLTDYIAPYFGVKSPEAYEQGKSNPQGLKNGVNFAYSGTGVFASYNGDPNMATQIDFLEQLIKQNVYSATRWPSSLSLEMITVESPRYFIGHDVAAWEDNVTGVSWKGHKGLSSYIASVVSQITTNLKRINGLGVKKIAVTGVGPLGCMPFGTALFLFQHCNDIYEPYITLHDNLLNQGVAKLNQEARDNSTCVVLDLKDTFRSILNNPQAHNFNQNPLEQCCVGVTVGCNCGDADANNVKKYQVCDDPRSAFFWDGAHPTQAAWNAVYNELRTTLQRLQF